MAIEFLQLCLVVVQRRIILLVVAFSNAANMYCYWMLHGEQCAFSLPTTFAFYSLMLQIATSMFVLRPKWIKRAPYSNYVTYFINNILVLAFPVHISCTFKLGSPLLHMKSGQIIGSSIMNPQKLVAVLQHITLLTKRIRNPRVWHWFVFNIVIWSFVMWTRWVPEGFNLLLPLNVVTVDYYYYYVTRNGEETA